MFSNYTAAAREKNVTHLNGVTHLTGKKIRMIFLFFSWLKGRYSNVELIHCKRLWLTHIGGENISFLCFLFALRNLKL